MVAKWGAALLAVAAVANSQTLKPAPPGAFQSATFKRQASSFTPDHELDMNYAEMDSYNDPNAQTFGAVVHIQTVDPAVQTEQFESLVSDITCSENDTTMSITFSTADAAAQAKSQWTAPYMTIITLTSTCNEDDLRVPWNVSTPVFNGNVATLTGKPTDWDTASSGLTVSFGNQGNVTNPTSVNGTHTKRDNGVSKDIGFNITDKTIYPPEIFGSLAALVPVAGRLTQTCIECTGTGTADLSMGKIDVKAAVEAAVASASAVAEKGVASASAVAVKGAATVSAAAVQAVATASAVAEDAASKVVGGVTSAATAVSGVFDDLFRRDEPIVARGDNPFADLANSISDGDISIDFSNMGGTFSFQSDIYSSKQFSVPLAGDAGIAISPLQIPGIMSIGPNVNPTLVFQFDANEDLSFNYGFTYTMPDGAGLDLNLLDPSKSTVNKLDQVSFKALPFSTNAKDVAAAGLNYTVAFRPTVSIGFTVLGQTIDPVQLIFNVPKITGTVAVDEGVDKTCKAAGDLDAFDVNAEFAFSLGIGASINTAIMNFSPNVTLASKTGLFPMSTCVPFHTMSASEQAAAKNGTSTDDSDSTDDSSDSTDDSSDSTDDSSDDSTDDSAQDVTTDSDGGDATETSDSTETADDSSASTTAAYNVASGGPPASTTESTAAAATGSVEGYGASAASTTAEATTKVATTTKAAGYGSTSVSATISSIIGGYGGVISSSSMSSMSSMNSSTTAKHSTTVLSSVKTTVVPTMSAAEAYRRHARAFAA